MKAISLTKRQFNKLKRYELPNEVLSTESKLYVLNESYCISDGKLLLKYFYSDDKMPIKLFNINTLSNYADKINIPEFMIPKYLGIVDSNIVGFVDEEILNATNLGIILNDPKVDNEKKLDYLYRVGDIVKRGLSLKKFKDIKFNFGDLHEYNFVTDKDDNLHVCDLDSCYLDSNYPLNSYYLVCNFCINSLQNKYKKNKDNIVYPSDNSDLFCYNMMILNTIARDKVSLMKMEDYFDYINYLKYLGFGEDILKSFYNLYTNADNINPYCYLDQVPVDKIGEAGLKIYKLKRNKNMI